MFNNEWGGAVAMTKIEGLYMYGPWVMNNPYRLLEIVEKMGRKKAEKEPAVGDGECVAIAQATLKMPLVAEWRPGVKVLGNGAPNYYQGREIVEIVGSGIQVGTVIATFVNKRYQNLDTGNHVAIYLGQGKGSIDVIDMWAKKDPKTRRVIGYQAPTRRTLYIKPGVSNNADAFSVVYTLKGGW